MTGVSFSADIDELAHLVFALELQGLRARDITVRVTGTVLAWAHSKGWSARTEARVQPSRPAAATDDYGYVDVIVRRGEGVPDLAIEIDQTDKPRSVAKLRYAMALGLEPVWIRWSGASWTDAAGIHVIHLPQAERRPVARRPPAQLTLW